MSYVVLARKYRPRNFAEMVGQEHVVQALSNALRTQRLHHAYLFTGTRGVGKTTVSRILAKSLNCLGADGQGDITAEPCGVCQACTDIDAGRFVDYTELDAASNRGVDEIQSLLEQSVYKPVQGRFKVFMIDEVHMLTNTAFNAMLKTLEEPPAYLKFVLATTDPQKVPVTVLSRCLQFNLRPMAPETIQEHLQQVLEAEAVGADVQSLRLISRAARGSMRDALSLTDQAIGFGGGQLQEPAVRQMLGAVDRSYVLRLIGSLASGDGAVILDTIDALRLNGLSAVSTLEEMTGVLQRMAVLQAVPARSGELDTDDPDAAEIARLARTLPADETQLLYSLCLHGRGEIGLAPDEYAGLTMVLLRLLAFKPAGVTSGVPAEKKTLNSEAEALAASLRAEPETRASTPGSVAKVQPETGAAGHLVPEDRQQPESSHGEGPPWVNPEPANVPSMPARPVVAIPVRDPGSSARLEQRREPQDGEQDAELVTTPEGNFWFEIVQAMIRGQSVTALVRELALQSQLVARDVDQWRLRVEQESLNQNTARERLSAALKAHGHDVALVVELGPVKDSPAQRLAAIAARQYREAEQRILQDPFVQSMMRDFGGKIVPGTLKATAP
jgi:DNA polymerase III subunit gamma/tau